MHDTPIPHDPFATPVEGSWRLVSYEVEVKDTGERFPPMGAAPTGYVMFAPEGRVWFMLTGEGRTPARVLMAEAEPGTFDAVAGLWHEFLRDPEAAVRLFGVPLSSHRAVVSHRELLSPGGRPPEVPTTR